MIRHDLIGDTGVDQITQTKQCLEPAADRANAMRISQQLTNACSVGPSFLMAIIIIPDSK